ncbi:Tetratricopeptide repeat protein [Pontibacter korlensis]|uniref:Tetratricopeptide repeat protein n=1 Tax=Pontibacter korlensis TaxID=400092 RepID=A0A0E3ZFP8_9BACT|nr:hypothetical protein PKOR_11260 [Pontibacter korlensis]
MYKHENKHEKNLLIVLLMACSVGVQAQTHGELVDQSYNCFKQNDMDCAIEKLEAAIKKDPKK